MWPAITVAGLRFSAVSSAASHSSMPVTPPDSVRYGVHAVVNDVARDEQTHLRHMQHRRRVGIGVTDLDRGKRDAVELETVFVDDGHVQLSGGNLSGEHPIPEVGTERRVVLRLHQLRGPSRRAHYGAGEPV